MFDRRQYELIRYMCCAGMKSPEANFLLARELIAIGEIAEKEIASADAKNNETAALATVERIKAERKAAKAARRKPLSAAAG